MLAVVMLAVYGGALDTAAANQAAHRAVAAYHPDTAHEGPQAVKHPAVSPPNADRALVGQSTASEDDASSLAFEGQAAASPINPIRIDGEVSDLIPFTHGTRRLDVINVRVGDDLQAVVDSASNGAELVLADGIYTSSGSAVLEISKDLTIRAQHSGQAVLDGQNVRRVILIRSGTVRLEGLNITKGQEAYVSACLSRMKRRSIAPVAVPNRTFLAL